MTVYTINLNPVCQLDDDKFYQLCRANPEIRFERNAHGALIVMPPTGGETGNLNSEINADFVNWNRRFSLGYVFDSSTCFKLPNGANRSPDVAWIERERWEALTAEQKQKFPPIVPDFILELMSPSDSLKATQAKMREYRDNGVQLGWLIVPETRRVEIYRQNKDVEVQASPATLSGESVLPNFTLDLQSVF